MTPDEANDLILDLIDAVRNEERFPNRFIIHNREVNEASNKISKALCDTVKCSWCGGTLIA